MADPRDEPAATTSSAEEAGEEPRDELQEQRQLAETYLDLARRTQAEFLNYKRRVENEQSARAEAARAEVVLALLPTLDEFELAMLHLPGEARTTSWVQGITLIERKLGSALERLGVQRIGEVGQLFDPSVHEAVLYDDRGEQPEGHVSAVLRPGYQLGGRVIRPAQVAVAQDTGRKTTRQAHAEPTGAVDSQAAERE
ncbi:MAG: nucleotide exchange factor GrpE [Chloroflexi bacterium]|nr:nucleotide exchange factor GrpE [Chloroflexota bacterium]